MRARAVDAVVAGAVGIVGGAPYVLALTSPSGMVATTGEAAVSIVVTMLLAIPLAWRRTHPRAAGAWMLAVCVGQLMTGADLVVGQLAVLVLIATVAAGLVRRDSTVALALGLAGVPLAAARFAWVADAPTASLPSVAFVIVTGWLAVVSAWAIGDASSRRRADRERDVDRAVADERARIAREMHDIIAHSLSIVITQADGARFAAPPAAGPVLPSLEAIAETARTSLADMRRVLGVLRDTGDDTSTRPLPGLADVEALVASAREAGLDVEYDSSVAPGTEPSPGAQLALYRVIQEALSNVRRHAGAGARASVAVSSDAHAVTVSVSDDGAGLPDDLGSTAGHGVVGMRERVALYDGDFDVVGGDSGGVRVLARIPHETVHGD
jgi:signal transduction histidine kinase